MPDFGMSPPLRTCLARHDEPLRPRGEALTQVNWKADLAPLLLGLQGEAASPLNANMSSADLWARLTFLHVSGPFCPLAEVGNMESEGRLISGSTTY